MTPLSSVSGLASGIDFQGLADAIIAAKRGPIRALETKIAGSQERSQAYLSLESRLQALQAAGRALETASGLIRNGVSIEAPGGGNAGFTASAGPGAGLGSYDVSVLQLAAPERLGGGEFADRAAPLGLEGGVRFNEVLVEVEAGDSLDDVVAKINNGMGGDGTTGVRASVVTVSDGSHKLVLSSQAEGAQGIQLEDAGGVLQGLGLLTSEGEKAEILQAGADARLKVDGVEVVRSSNTMDDVVEGITFTLLQADPGTTSRMEVGRDTGGLKGAIRDLAETYNAVARFVRTQSGSGEGTRPPLAGDAVLRSVANSLQAAMLGFGGDPDGDGPRRLGDLGVTIQVDGTFAIDTARLDAALAANPEAVARLFELRSSSSDPAVSLLGTGAHTLAGDYHVQITAAATPALAEGSAVDDPLSGVVEGDLVRIRSLGGSREVEVLLEEGMSLDELASRITSALAQEGIAAEATVDGSRLKIQSMAVGSAQGFVVELEGNAASLSGLAPGEFRGTDVQGTVNGQAAAGSGSLLTVTGEGPARGLSLHVEGFPAGGEATVGFARGVGAQVQLVSGRATGTGASSLRGVQDRLQESADRMRARADTLAERLEAQREQLYRRFAAVEEAISRAQSQGTHLAAQLDQIGRFQYGPRRR